MGTRNTLVDLNNHLFAQLERLDDESVKGEKLSEEIERAKAVSGIAKNVIENGRLVLSARQFQDEKLDDNVIVPRMLVGDGSGEAKKE